MKKEIKESPSMRAARAILDFQTKIRDVVHDRETKELLLASIIEKQLAYSELLEACKMMLSRWDSLDMNNLGLGCRDLAKKIAEYARAAIAKTEGCL